MHLHKKANDSQDKNTTTVQEKDDIKLLFDELVRGFKNDNFGILLEGLYLGVVKKETLEELTSRLSSSTSAGHVILHAQATWLANTLDTLKPLPRKSALEIIRNIDKEPEEGDELAKRQKDIGKRMKINALDFMKIDDEIEELDKKLEANAITDAKYHERLLEIKEELIKLDEVRRELGEEMTEIAKETLNRMNLRR